MNTQCPHCLSHITPSIYSGALFSARRFDSDSEHNTKFEIENYSCTNEKCEKPVITLVSTKYEKPKEDTHVNTSSIAASVIMSVKPQPVITRTLVYPRGLSRQNVIKSDIPDSYYSDYEEAVLVLPHSLKASAALTRRILQHLLREEANVVHGTLASEIKQVIESDVLPSRISSLLDAVREVGNFAAHPTKSSSTSEIVDVEPGEAELNLEVVEELFDFYFTSPRLTQERIDGINTKLKKAGKKPISL